jgi:hypothetical protein
MLIARDREREMATRHRGGTASASRIGVPSAVAARDLSTRSNISVGSESGLLPRVRSVGSSIGALVARRKGSFNGGRRKSSGASGIREDPAEAFNGAAAVSG